MVNLMRDVKSKYLAGGYWKIEVFRKKGKRSFTTSKPARFYTAIPPIEGWLGGDPLKNGYKPTGGK